jgi:uncharacterized protein YndB with AHSA1/START domain
MAESFEVSKVLAVRPERLYGAWLDGAEHARFTGGPATGSARVGAPYSAWDGYIQGKNLELESPRRIVQSWRTSEFPEGAADSKVEVLFDAVEGGTRLTVRHTDIPDGQADRYRDGWDKHYFAPMEKYFSGPASRLRDAGEAVAAAVDQAGQAVGEAVSGAGEQAGAALKSVQKTARQAARAVQKLVKNAKKKLARKPVVKAKPKPKAKAKKPAGKKAKPPVKKARGARAKKKR